jgi:putative ABC transport system permease protein
VTRTALSQRIASRVIRLLAPLVPPRFRARWREEWLAEIDSAEGGPVVRRACGAWRDVLACRALTGRTRETAAFGGRGLAFDIRYSGRAIRRSPGFTVAAVASLSIGIAATTTAFSAVNALLFRSLPGVRESGRLVQAVTIAPWLGGSASPQSSYLQYRDALSSLSDVAAFTRMRAAIATPTESVAASAVLVSPNYFGLLGTTAAAGRLLDEGMETHTAAVASYDFALRHFQSAAASLGQRVSVNGVPLDIVGVAPPQFIGVRPGDFGEGDAARPQLWIGLAARPLLAPPPNELMNRPEGGSGAWVDMVGRLAPGVTLAQAKAQAATLPPQAVGNTGGKGRIGLVPLGRGANDSDADIAAAVALALGIPFIVLVIGCANTANLQLARAARREAEIAVRRSLGATRGVIVRQLLVESVLVAAVAGLIAVVITAWASRLLTAYMPVPCPVDWRVLLFAIAAVLTAGIGFGAAPALAATRGSLTAPLKDSTATALHRRSRLRSGLVVAQVALSILLLTMAGLFTRSLQRLKGAGEEREMSHVAAATMDLGLLKYSPQRGRAFQEELLARTERIPGVAAAAIAPFAPFSGTPGLTYRTEQHEGPAPFLYANGGAPRGHFVEAARLRVVRGRGFTDEDRAGETPKVALVSETLARLMSPSGEVLGQRILVADGQIPKTEVTIVGVTADASFRATRSEVRALLLPVPLSYDPVFSLWVRTSGDPAVVLPAIRAIVRDLDPALPIRRLGAADSWRAEEIAPVRWMASGFGFLGLLAVCLAGAGLYAVMSYLVANRRHEMGVRVALGASPRDLARLITGQAIRMALPGLVIGALLSAGAARISRAMLIGVSPLDPIALGGVSLLLVVVALFSTVPPALRAARLDPLVTLRRQ